MNSIKTVLVLALILTAFTAHAKNREIANEDELYFANNDATEWNRTEIDTTPIAEKDDVTVHLENDKSSVGSNPENLRRADLLKKTQLRIAAKMRRQANKE